MLPVSPGAIAPRGQVGTVQPQDAEALLMRRGTVPVFVKEKEWVTISPSGTRPKS